MIGGIWTFSSLVGIPDAVSLEAKSSVFTKEHYPCMQDDILWDLTQCAPTWSADVDFSFTIVKVSLVLQIYALW
jgi:hypothetical protein